LIKEYLAIAGAEEGFKVIAGAIAETGA